MIKFDIDILNSYKDEGKLRCSKHDTLPLYIWNYTDRVQCNTELWDDVTINCRALVTDAEGNVVARSFPKFFNMEEKPYHTSMPHEIFEKLDGSLGLLFYCNDEWIFASRGSFHSEQAEMGARILNKTYPQYKDLNTEYTYIFEIIYPENKIVVDYGNTSKLVYLSQYDKHGIEHMNIESMQKRNFDVVEEYVVTNSFKEYKEQNIPNQEGYVVRFNDGVRMKIKFEDYIELHRIRFNVNVKLVIKTFKDNNFDKAIEVIPDELMEWFKETYILIENKYNEIKQVIYILFVEFYIKSRSKKDFALLIAHLDSATKAALFMLWNNIEQNNEIRLRNLIIDKLMCETDFKEYGDAN